jgi:hypothetical protein
LAALERTTQSKVARTDMEAQGHIKKAINVRGILDFKPERLSRSFAGLLHQAGL